MPEVGDSGPTATVNPRKRPNETPCAAAAGSTACSLPKMEELATDEALCFVETITAFGGLTARPWPPSPTAAAIAVGEAHSGGMPSLRGTPFYMLLLGTGY